MPWYVQQSTGKLEKAAKLPGTGWLLITGSTDTMTQAQAEQALIQMVLHDNQGINVAPGIAAAGNATANAIGSATGLTGLDGFLKSLGTQVLWIRVAKIVVGGALLLIGVAHMTGADNAVAAVARKAPLPV